MGIVPDSILADAASNAVLRSQGQADNAAHFQDRMDDLYEMVHQRLDGAASGKYQSPEIINWLEAKREAYANVLDDIKFKGGMPRAERRKQRDMAR
tara:strand:+ start:6010 stop:6297 length:288 start_codon:yes stop_codon:yes gene_type:complete